jgi:hypothetical protein
MKTYTDKNPTIAMKRLRRLAPRALRVVERHQEEHSDIAHYQGTLVPAALDFIERYGTIVTNGSRAPNRTSEAHTSVNHLMTRARAWFGPLQRDLPGIELRPASTVPDDVLAAVEHVLDHIEPRIADGTLPYGEALMADLGGALEAARAEWKAAQAAMAQAQAERAELRIAANRFVDELIALRKTLRATLGSSHRDYQKLRTARASVPDADDTPETETTEPTGAEEVSLAA